MMTLTSPWSSTLPAMATGKPVEQQLPDMRMGRLSTSYT